MKMLGTVVEKEPENEASRAVHVFFGFNGHHAARHQVSMPTRRLVWMRIGSEVEDQVKVYFTSGGR